MIYYVETTPQFDKQMGKLNRYTQIMILNWMEKNLEETENPRIHGKPLVANQKGKWRYRIGDYRLLAKIDDEKLVILALAIGHRREVYR